MHSTYMTAVQPLHRLTLIVALLLGGIALLAGMLGASAPIRFVCTPAEGARPRSATWELGE